MSEFIVGVALSVTWGLVVWRQHRRHRRQLADAAQMSHVIRRARRSHLRRVKVWLQLAALVELVRRWWAPAGTVAAATAAGFVVMVPVDRGQDRAPPEPDVPVSAPASLVPRNQGVELEPEHEPEPPVATEPPVVSEPEPEAPEPEPTGPAQEPHPEPEPEPIRAVDSPSIELAANVETPVATVSTTAAVTATARLEPEELQEEPSGLGGEPRECLIGVGVDPTAVELEVCV